MRIRSRHERELERMLRAARPQPPDELVEKLLGQIEPRRQMRPLRGRIVLALVMTLGLLVALPAFGAVGYASSAVEQAVSAVTGAPPAAPTRSTSARDQYKEQRKQCRKAVSAAHSDYHARNRQNHRTQHASGPRSQHKAWHAQSNAAHRRAHEDIKDAREECNEIGDDGDDD